VRQRGFTLVEVLAAVLILGIVITTTLAIFTERARRLQQANDTILAYQALANEAEIRRRVDFNTLDQSSHVFLSSTTILEPLEPYTTQVTVEDASVDVKNVTMQVIWRGGKRVASLRLARVNTGGQNLW
jgi:prepilin-type N-terminal cleavage/methylation domain-containing protein